MDAPPYTFDSKNPRLVTNVAPKTQVMVASGLIFLVSLRMYTRHYFRIDQNVMNLVGFAALSAPASYSYGNFFFNDPINEAGILNNEAERKH